MDQKTTIIVLVVSFALLIGGALFYSAQENAANNDGVILVEKVKGNPDAEVVLAEYSDFECPACASFAPVLNSLVEEHGDKLRFEYHHFPLVSIHRNAELAARASEAAGVQGKFWEMHDLLFERQTQWSRNLNPRNVFVSYAEELELNVDQFESNLNASIIRDEVQADMREGRDFGLTGTPSFFLNGERVDTSQFQTFDDFVNLVEVALGVAETNQEAVSSSVPTTDVDFSF